MAVQLRLKGVVRAMNHVRQRLAAGIPPAEQAEFRAFVNRTVAEVERLCRAHGTRPDRLPRATYSAYRFMKDLDLARLPAPDAGAPPGGAARVRGLTAFTGDVRARLAALSAEPVADRGAGLEALVENIAEYVGWLERSAAEGGRDLGTLPDPSRRAHQWLAWLAEPGNIVRHVETLALLASTGKSVVGHADRPRTTRGLPVQVELYHIAPMYRTRVHRDAIHLTAGQLFVDAPEEVLAALILAASGARAKGLRATLHGYALGEDASEVSLAIELAGAPPPLRTRGRHHDLAQVFTRVNVRNFGGRLSTPKLTWSRVHTRRKLGHFQPHTDTVMLSVTLDDPKVPDYVVDFVMYHELLHRVMGVETAGDRTVAHGPAFRRAEARFPDFGRAQRFLNGGR